MADLQQLYRAAKKRFDEEEDFKVGWLAAVGLDVEADVVSFRA